MCLESRLIGLLDAIALVKKDGGLIVLVVE